MKQMADADRHDIDRISHLNAMRHFHYEPFSVIPKEEATVAALRRRAIGHDVSIQSKAKRFQGPSSTKAADLAKMSSSAR
jgi:hypothetical protein